MQRGHPEHLAGAEACRRCSCMFCMLVFLEVKNRDVETRAFDVLFGTGNVVMGEMDIHRCP